MSMYHMVFGNNKFFLCHHYALDIVGVEHIPEIRWRDTYLRRINDEVKICMLTRTGYEEDYKEINEMFRQHPAYVSDRVLNTDSTYREFVFDVPKAVDPEQTYVQAIEPMIRQSVEQFGKTEEFKQNGEMEMLFEDDPDERWKKLFSDLENGKETPDTKRAIEAGKKVAEELKDALNSDDSESAKIIQI